MDEGKSEAMEQGPTSPSSDNSSSSNDVVILSHPSSITSPVTPFTPSNNGHLSTSSLTPTTPSSTNPKKRKRLTTAEREERDRERQEKRLKLEQEKLKRDEEKRKKDEEKQKREEERLKKIEENKKKEEERLLKKHQQEEEKRIKKEQLEEEKRIKKEQLEQEKQKREDEKRKKQEEIDKKNRDKEAEKKKKEEELAKQAKLLKSYFQKSPSTNKGPKKIVPIKIGDLDKSSLDTSFGKSENSNDSSKSNVSNIDPSLIFRPIEFQIKSHMALAPRVRREFTLAERKKLDQYGFCSSNNNNNNSSSKENKDPTNETTTISHSVPKPEEPMEIDLLENEDKNNSHDDGSTSVSSSVPNPNEKNDSNYLLGLKKHGGRTSERTQIPDPETKDDPEVEVISDKIMENPRAQGLVKWRYKLLQFHDNRRPAYWGTWKKPANHTNAKNPLRQEKDIDYEYDSDDDWEDEPEDGEDLGNSDKEDDEEKGDSEEDDDGWLVPHGYISDDEGAQDEHLDKEALKLQEKNYFDDLNKQIKVNLPEIQIHRLSNYKMIFSPAMKKWKEMSSAFKAFNPIPSSSATSVFTSPSSQKVCNTTSSTIAN